MASKVSAHLTGEDWQSKLVHVEYEEAEVAARYEFFFNLDRIVGGQNGQYTGMVTCGLFVYTGCFYGIR